MKARCLIVALTIIAAACGSTIYLRTDYDTTANFSKYRTFAVKQGNSSGNPVMDQRVAHDVAETLAAKGYMLAPEDAADAIVVVNAATREKHTYEVFYDGWPGWGWRFGWGAPVVERYDFTVGTLVVDIFDATTKQAVWHGSAGDVLAGDPEKDARRIQQAVAKLLERFPPRERST